MTPKITIAVQCYDFEIRLAWMLSSLLAQTEPGLVIVDIAHVRENGKPTVERVVENLSTDWPEPKLKIKRTIWEDFEEFQLRGITRTKQLQECETEWIMFADCDMVYHECYFDELLRWLGANAKGASCMFSSGRISLPKQLVNEMVNGSPAQIGSFVPNAFAKADALAPKKEMRNVGAGFCQIVNAKHCPHGGYYVLPDGNRDVKWDRSRSKPKSDMQFRKRVAAALPGNERRKLPQWFTDNAIHLNHNRDEDIGVNTREQR